MSDVNQAIQAQFGKVAENYKHSAVHAAGEDLQGIVAWAQQTAPANIMDVGCGAGHVAVNIAPYCQHVIAYDLTPSMLEQVNALAREKGVTNVVTREGNAEQLPFEDASFDAVVSRYSAHHWQHPLKALQEIARILKPGGQFVLSDIVAHEEAAQDTFLQTIELLRDGSHVRDHCVSQWTRMFEQVGLITDVAFEWQLPLNFEAWVTRMATPPAKIAILKTLFDEASREIRESFAIREHYDFSIPGALLVGKKPSTTVV